MFLLLSKLLDLLLSPLTWALLFGVGGLLLRRWPRVAVASQVAALLVLYVFSVEPVVAVLTRATEAAAVSTYQPDVVYDAVILLGGGLDAGATERSGQPEYNAAPERMMRTFELLHDGRARQVLITGGNIDTRPEALVEANVLAAQLEHWGIAPERIVKEGRSRNTRENALQSEPLIRAHGWKSLLLVTSAAHLPRAAGCFAAVGVRADTLAVDIRSSPLPPSKMSWLPRMGALNQSTDMLRELAGRLVYRVRGWTAP
jgi:uncharacterized SAM-binding protein YcdF (DUF218 family)